MSNPQAIQSERRLTTPRAAAIAGILFAILYTASQVLIWLALPDSTADTGAVLAEQAEKIRVALSLVPLAGIAFLYFIGVVRDRLGEHEDRFYSTLFFGGSLLYLAMIFVSAAIAGGLLASYTINPQIVDEELFSFSFSVMNQINNIYGLRMASIVMTSLGTILMRTGVMPRWSAILTTVLAIIFLVSISLNVWMKLLFPAWVFLISLLILIANYRGRVEVDAAAADTA